MQITVPAHFAGPIPHAHDELDEAIYVLRGRLLVAGDDAPREAVAGSMVVAPRGQRHSFSTPHGTVAWMLGIWAPPASRSPSCATSGPP
jgi:quercetin dioxygenase-like cupin family protein